MTLKHRVLLKLNWETIRVTEKRKAKARLKFAKTPFNHPAEEDLLTAMEEQVLSRRRSLHSARGESAWIQLNNVNNIIFKVIQFSCI